MQGSLAPFLVTGYTFITAEKQIDRQKSERHNVEQNSQMWGAFDDLAC